MRGLFCLCLCGLLISPLALYGCKGGSRGGADGLGPVGKDPGAQLSLQSGVQTAKQMPPQKVQAEEGMAGQGHYYLLGGVSDMGMQAPGPWDVRLEGARHGLAFVQGSNLWVRLVGEEPPLAPLLVKILRPRSRFGWEERPEPQVHTVELSPSPGPSPRKDLPQRYFKEMSDAFSFRWTQDFPAADAFASFVSGRASVFAGRGDRAKFERPRQAAKTDLGEMMALYTGMSSVQEALQVDRGLLLRASKQERTVNLADIQGVPLAEHPWEKMLAALPAGQRPKIEPLASRVPADMLYAHFNDLRTFVKLTSEIDQLGTPLVQIFETHPGDYGIGARYERELMVERMGLAEKLGHLAADGVAVVAGDPFLREGADVAVLFHVKDRTTLLAALDYYEQRAKKAFPDLTVETRSLAGTQVRLATAGSGLVRQFRAEADGVLILSNSEACLERILQVGKEGHPALASSGDFRYMRALFPYDDDPKTGFVFLPDAFVARAVSPRTKILAARRLAAQAAMRAVGYAALLYGWLEGKRPESVDQLLAHGVLRPEDLKDENGRPIHVDLVGGAWSVTWGRPAALTPLADLAIDKVSEDERRAYDRFRETYQSYWRRYIDPVAAQIRYLDDGRMLDVDVRILPLIDNSDYDELVERAGRKTISPPKLRGAVQWTFAVGDNAKLRRELDQIGRAFLPGQEAILGWLGDWVMFGVLDTSGLWDLALATHAVPDRKVEDDRQFKALKEVGKRFPLYAGAHVRSKMALAALLTALKTQADNVAPGMIRWGQGPKYRGVPVVEIGPADEKEFRLTVCYATVEDVFVIAIGRETIEALIDARLDGHLSRSEGDAQALMDVATLGPDSWLSKTVLGLMETGVRSANRLAFRHMQTLSRGRIDLEGDPQAVRQIAMAYLGFEPVSPNGGRFEEIAPGLIRHTLYGRPDEPVYPALPIPDAPATRVVRSLAQLHAHLSFEGEGDSQGLRARFQIHRRAKL